MEGLAASYLSNKDDKTLLTLKEVKEEFGSWTQFMLAYGLKPYNVEIPNIFDHQAEPMQ